MSYILKDDLKMLWGYADTESAEKFLDSWIERAKETDIRALKDFAKTLENYKYGLLNHANYPINSGKIEGMNNKIKVIKRVAEGNLGECHKGTFYAVLGDAVADYSSISP